MKLPHPEHPWRAGAAHVVANPPAGVDLVGYLRRWRASQGNGQPIEVNVLVTDGLDGRLGLVALDTGSVVGDFATRIRDVVAETIGTKRSSVLVNASHTHCAPPLPGHIKTGGSTALPAEAELQFAELLLDSARSAADLAVSRLTECRVGFAKLPFDGGVNRRQRTPDGSTIMGWNPDGPTDPDLSVVRIESLAGDPVCCLISYSCHPTVLGPAVLNSSSDFVGPLRAEMRKVIGGECLFLQGTAGNIFPLEAVHNVEGPEDEFGRRMAHVALCAYDNATVLNVDPVQVPYKSAVDVAIWRLQPRTEQPVLVADAVELPVELPLMPLPTRDEMQALHDSLQTQLDDLRDSGERDLWNATWLHTEWASRMVERLSAATSTSVTSTVSAMMIGRILLISLPCEPFCEIGLAIKDYFEGLPVVVVGYSNDMIGYVAPAAEYPLGGYEPWIAPRHFDQPAPYETTAADVLVHTGIAAGKKLLAKLAREEEAS